MFVALQWKYHKVCTVNTLTWFQMHIVLGQA